MSREDVGGKQGDVGLCPPVRMTVTTKLDVWCGEEVDDKILNAEIRTKLAKSKAIAFLLCFHHSVLYFSDFYTLFLLKSVVWDTD